MVMQNERENEDMHSMSHQLESNIKIDYDLKSLMKSEFVYDIDPEVVDPDMPDSLFVRQQRKRAETKLISPRSSTKWTKDWSFRATNKNT